MRKVEVAERSARLARRHRVAPGERAADVVEAATSMVCLHATDPPTTYLSALARVDDFTAADLDHALYEERSLVKHLAMRRTLFVFPRDALAAAQAGASSRVADREGRRLIKEVETSGLHADGERWLTDASQAVLALLADGREATSSEMRAELPLLEGTLSNGEGRSWGGKVPVGPRVLTVLSAEGKILRGTVGGGAWTTIRPRWVSTGRWLGDAIEPIPDSDGVAWLVEHWLRTFGPGTVNDMKWWLGSTLTAVRAALAELDVVEVELETGAGGGTGTGYLMADDEEPVEPLEPWAAILPPLDPTTMGWIEREWYLGPYKQQLFDTTGNAGPTIWVDGRIVGAWRQTDAGAVDVHLLEPVDASARRLIDVEVDRVAVWLDGTKVLQRYPAPVFKALADPAG